MVKETIHHMEPKQLSKIKENSVRNNPTRTKIDLMKIVSSNKSIRPNERENGKSGNECSMERTGRFARKPIQDEENLDEDIIAAEANIKINKCPGLVKK